MPYLVSRNPLQFDVDVNYHLPKNKVEKIVLKRCTRADVCLLIFRIGKCVIRDDSKINNFENKKKSLKIQLNLGQIE